MTFLLSIQAFAATASEPGSLDLTFIPDSGPSNAVERILLQGDGKILVSGTELSFSGRLNVDGSRDTSFQPSKPVYLLALQPDGRIIAGSVIEQRFADADVALLRLNSNGTTDPGFSATAVVAGPGSLSVGFRFPGVIVEPDGKILLAGFFGQVNGKGVGSLARLNSDGSLDPTFDASSVWPGSKLSLAPLPHGGGLVTVANGYLLRFNSDGSLEGEIAHSQLDARAILVQDASIYAMHSYPYRLLRLNLEGQTQPDSFPVMNGLVTQIVPDQQGNLLLGGEFTQFDALAAPGLVRLLAGGGVDPGFNTGAGPTGLASPSYDKTSVQAIAVQSDGKFLVGGSFTQFDGMSRWGLARLMGGASSNFVPVISEQPSAAIATNGQEVVFTVAASGIPTPEYQWQRNGTNIPGANANVFQIPQVAVTDAGQYQVMVHNAAGSVPSDVAALIVEAETLHPGSLDPLFGAALDLDGPLQALAVQPDGKILIAGSFSRVSGSPRSGLARLLPDGTFDPTFDPSSASPSSVSKIIVQPDGRILFADVQGVRRLKPDGNLDPRFRPPAGTTALGTVQSDGKIIVGGPKAQASPVGIYTVETMPVWRLGIDGTLDTTFNPPQLQFSRMPPSNSGSVGITDVFVRPDGKILVTGTFDAGPNSIQFFSNGTVDTGFTPLPFDSDPFIIRFVRQQSNGHLAVWFNDTTPLFTSDFVLLDANAALVHDHLLPYDVEQAVAVLHDDRLVEGQYDSNRPQIRSLAVRRPDGTLEPSFQTEISGGSFAAIAGQPGQGILIGGDFTYVNGVRRSFLARMVDSITAIPRTLSCSLRDSSEAQRMNLAFGTTAGQKYTVQSCESLSVPNWDAFFVLTGDGAIKTVTDSRSAGPQRFYRLRVE